MKDVIFIKHDLGDEVSRFTIVPPKDKNDGTYMYAEGRSCTVYKAENSGNVYLIKKFKEGFQPPKLQKDRDVSKYIEKIHSNARRTYIPHQEYMGTDEKGNRYQVFKFITQSELEELIPLPNAQAVSREALGEGIHKLLITFQGLLSHVGLIHNPGGYLHCDITLQNVIVFKPNDQPTIQLIDWDSALKVNKLLEWDAEKIENYILRRSSPKMCIFGLLCEVYTKDDIRKYSQLDFKKDLSLAYVLDTTALAKILCFLLFGNTTFKENELTRSYQEAFPQSFMLLKDFFSTAFSSELENRFTSCNTMSKKIDEVIKGLLRWINYNNAHVELLTRHFGRQAPEQAVEARLQEINFGILPHIQFGETVYVQQDTRSPLEQLMELSHDKALFLYGEGGIGKSTTAKHFFYSTLRDRPENRLVLYFSLTQEGISDIERNLENPLPAELRMGENRPIVLLDALDESAIVISTDKNKYQKFYMLLQKYSHRYLFIVTSRNIPEDSSKNIPSETKEETNERRVSFYDVFQTGTFLTLSDEQLKGLIENEGMTIDALEQDRGKELIETLRLPMMLKLFLDTFGHASEKDKQDILSITNETQLIWRYFEKLYRDKKGSLYHTIEYDEDYFKKECMLIAEAAFSNESVKLHPRTLRIFNSVITPIRTERFEERIRIWTKTLYKTDFYYYDEDAQKKYREDIQNQEIPLQNDMHKTIFKKVLLYLDDCINETLATDSNTHNKWGYRETKTPYLLLQIYDFITNFDMLEFSHKVFRDFFRAMALAYHYEELLSKLKYDFQFDIYDIIHMESTSFGLYEDYQTINTTYCQAMTDVMESFYHRVWYLLRDKYWTTNELKFTGILLGLSGNRLFAHKRKKQLEYIYRCYLIPQKYHSLDDSCIYPQFGGKYYKLQEFINDINHMVCLSYKYFEEDPFYPSEDKSFDWCQIIEETYGSRYAVTYRVPVGVKKIDSFDYCPKLEAIILSESVECVDPHAFDNCPLLETIDYGAAEYNFCPGNNYWDWDSDDVPNSYWGVACQEDNDIVFQKDGGYPIWPRTLPDELIIPEEVRSIGGVKDCSHAFKEAKSIVISNGPEYIDYDAFKDCHKLIHVVIPESILAISESAFKDCHKLIHVEIPESIQAISESAFDGCTNLSCLTVSKNIFVLTDMNKTMSKGYRHWFWDPILSFPTVTTLRYTGTSAEWRAAEKPKEFFTVSFPNLEEVLCLGDDVTLTGEAMKV